ncbi:hypothetical protein RFI_23074, partial [Reticulomyxa filosa]
EISLIESICVCVCGTFIKKKVSGQDAQGNDFTTLRGLPLVFHGLGIHVKQLKFEDAKLIMPETYSEMTRQPTDLIPVQGYSTGKETVWVALDKNREPFHRAEKGEADLFVVQQFSVDPPQLYMPQCTTAYLSLLTTTFVHPSANLDETQYTRTRLVLPDSQFKFTMDTKGMLSTVDNSGVIKSSTRTEKFKVTAIDTLYHENSKPVLVQVMDPNALHGEIMTVVDPKDFNPRPSYHPRDEKEWYLAVNTKYHMRFTLWTVLEQQAHVMCMRRLEHKYQKDNVPKTFNSEHICEGIHFEIRFFDDKNILITDNELETKFGRLKDTRSGLSHQDMELTPLRKGQYLLLVIYTPCGSVRDGISFTRKIVVTDPLVLRPTSAIVCPMVDHRTAHILLPYTGLTNRHEVDIFVRGGSGTFLVEVANTTIAKLTMKEEPDDFCVVTVAGSKLGLTYGFVMDSKNPENFVFVPIEVARILRWKFDEVDKREVLLDHTADIVFRIRANEGRHFSSLQGLQSHLSVDGRKPLFQSAIDYNRANTDKLRLQARDDAFLWTFENEQDPVKLKQYFVCDNHDLLVTMRAVAVGLDIIDAHLKSFPQADKQVNDFAREYRFVRLF